MSHLQRKLLKSRPDVVKYIRKLTYKIEYNRFQSSQFLPTHPRFNHDNHLLSGSSILPNSLQTIPRLNYLKITDSTADWNKLKFCLDSENVNHLIIRCCLWHTTWTDGLTLQSYDEIVSNTMMVESRPYVTWSSGYDDVTPPENVSISMQREQWLGCPWSVELIGTTILARWRDDAINGVGLDSGRPLIMVQLSSLIIYIASASSIGLISVSADDAQTIGSTVTLDCM